MSRDQTTKFDKQKNITIKEKKNDKDKTINKKNNRRILRHMSRERLCKSSELKLGVPANISTKKNKTKKIRIPQTKM